MNVGFVYNYFIGIRDIHWNDIHWYRGYAAYYSFPILLPDAVWQFIVGTGAKDYAALSRFSARKVI
ncbi:MAG: hypothetical protein HKN43_17050 [Rhodothermales bacterium]|nr:hypothetical protein [Rhodothermales bacterium]